MSPAPHRSFFGWGRTNPTVAESLDIAAADVPDGLKEATRRGALVRGLGRSYGDAAQNGGGLLLRLRATPREVLLDPSSATARVPAGLSIDELLRVIVPRGFFVPVTPGTRLVTIGGAIASDIHGKNHHVDGSFGNHVAELTMVLADGSTIVASPTLHADAFWATIGGMGLTGAITEAVIRLLPISTSRVSVDTSRIGDLDTLLATMTDGDEHHRYSVAWIDLMATGRHLGRSVLTRGDHAVVDQLDAAHAVTPLAYGPRTLSSVPPLVPAPGFVNRASCAAFNELWFRRAPRHRVGELQGIAEFFHPLDLVGSWNRLYGRRGFVQYQVVLPFGHELVMRTLIERLAAHGTPSFLAVLKRFGAANPAPLSFPQPGWTLALDVPAGSPGLSTLLHALDDLVLDAGGRHYLAKDAHTTPTAIRRGYPRLAEWQAVRARLDPLGVWQSDLERRLGLTE